MHRYPHGRTRQSGMCRKSLFRLVVLTSLSGTMSAHRPIAMRAGSVRTFLFSDSDVALFRDAKSAPRRARSRFKIANVAWMGLYSMGGVGPYRCLERSRYSSLLPSDIVRSELKLSPCAGPLVKLCRANDVIPTPSGMTKPKMIPKRYHVLSIPYSRLVGRCSSRL